MSKLWLKQNTRIEKYSEYFSKLEETTKKETLQINKNRKRFQEQIQPEFLKYKKRFNDAFFKQLEIKVAYNELEAKLANKGYSIEEYLHKKKEEEIKRKCYDPNDAANNTTLKQYLEVNQDVDIELEDGVKMEDISNVDENGEKGENIL
jgi:hypothetical protein